MKSARPPRYETRRAKSSRRSCSSERAPGFRSGASMTFARFRSCAAQGRCAICLGSGRAARSWREKLRLGFLDWLAVPTEAARPARLPVVFKLTDSARDESSAAAPTKLQVEAADTSVILETETDVLVLPRGLQVVVGVDGAADAFYLPPPGLSNLAPLEPLPTQWQLKSFASMGATKVQLDPPQGLVPEMLIEIGGQQYRVTEVKKDIVTLDPPLTSEQATQAIATKWTAFAPFDPAARNLQEHALHLGTRSCSTSRRLPRSKSWVPELCRELPGITGGRAAPTKRSSGMRSASRMRKSRRKRKGSCSRNRRARWKYSSS